MKLTDSLGDFSGKTAEILTTPIHQFSGDLMKAQANYQMSQTICESLLSNWTLKGRVLRSARTGGRQ